MMEIVRYAVVFFSVGWGGGLIGGALFLVTSPLLLRLRGTVAGRALTAATNGVSIFAAVYLSHIACRWTGEDPTYLMYALAFLAMFSNDLRRISRARVVRTMAGQPIEDDEMRAGIIQTEEFNLIADVNGFLIGVVFIGPLSIL